MRLCWLVVACVLGACQTLGERPARLIDPGPQTMQALAAVFKEATGRDVLVANDAFTGASVLHLSVSERRSVNQRPRMGRAMVTPLRFDLVIQGNRCSVVDARNQQRYPLDGARCEAEAEQ